MKIDKIVVVQWFVNSIMAQSVRFAPQKIVAAIIGQK